MSKEILTIIGWNYDKFEEEFKENVIITIISKNLNKIILQDFDKNDIQLLFESNIMVSELVKDNVIIFVSETNYKEIEFELN